MRRPTRIAVLASGEGTTLQALLDAVAEGRLPAEIALVVSNNSGAKALERAREAGCAYAHISAKTHPENPGAALVDALEHAGTELVVLAGYMKKLPAPVIEKWPMRVVNTHPGPLPEFGGRGMFGDWVHEAVLERGCTQTGPTVHLVVGDYDEGPILGHTPVSVQPDDDVPRLKARVQAAERELIVRVLLDRFCS